MEYNYPLSTGLAGYSRWICERAQKVVDLAAEIVDGLRCLAEWKRASVAPSFSGSECCRKKRGVGRFFGGVVANFFVVFVFGLSHSATMRCLLINA